MYRSGVAVVFVGWVLVLVNAFSANNPTTTAAARLRKNCSPQTKGIPTIMVVPRIRKDEFDPSRDYYQFGKDGDIGDHQQNDCCGRPLLIEGALSPMECEACCDRLIDAADTLQIDLQQQQQGEDTQIYQCTLAQAIDAIMRKSNSKKAYMTFCEGLLEEGDDKEAEGLHEVQRWTTAAKEDLFGDDRDWFDFFPSWAQPTDAVIVAGAGATSTLHRDPMEWTGTSLCLEGTKVWRFLEPPSLPNASLGDQQQTNPNHKAAIIDQSLQSYRLDSIAWESDGNDGEDDEQSTSPALSAGWQSDFSLYHMRDHAVIPSAQSLAEMADAERYELLDKLALSLETLKPNLPATMMVSGDMRIHTVIQKPGDLLLIPAHWWHQTYAFEPSVAIASQRCGRGDSELVFRHILEKQQQGKGNETNHYDPKSILDGASNNPEVAVASLFNSLRAQII